MSASLVGSEMCIRDRFHGAEGFLGGFQISPSDQSFYWGFPGARFEASHAVSYTHLTLPTICSV
eukprot:3190644-Alexandrium_andersonii.AAC.1